MASSIWFKRAYVDPILSGEKVTTMRRVSSRYPAIGSIVPASVGPRKPFAWIEIMDVEIIPLSELSEQDASELRALYGPIESVRVIHFRLYEKLRTD